MFQRLQTFTRFYEPVRLPMLALTLSHIFFLFNIAWFTLNLDGEVPLSELYGLYIALWCVFPLLGLALTVLTAGWFRRDANALWDLVAYDLFFILFALSLVRLVMTAQGLNTVLGIFLGVFVVYRVASLLMAKYRSRVRGLHRVGLGLVTALVLYGAVAFLPLTITKTYENASFVMQSRGRLLYPCQDITWVATGEISQVRIAEGDPLPTDGSLQLCYRGIGDPYYLTLDLVMPDGENHWSAIRLSGVTHGQAGLALLAGLGLVFGAALVIKTGRYTVLPIVAVSGGLLFVQVDEPLHFLVIGIAAVAGGSLFMWGRTRLKLPQFNPLPYDLLMVVVIIPLLFINLTFPYDRWHHSFIVGPANDVLHGGVPLVDIPIQYGVGITYLLAGIFSAFPVLLSFQGFSLLLSLLLALTVVLLYGFLRLNRVNPWIATAAVAVMCVISVYRHYFSELTNPTLGSLRYIWQYVLVLLLTIRTTRNVPTVAYLEALALAFAAFWSLDGFYMVWVAYFAVMLVEGVFTETRWRDLALRVALAVGVTLALYGGFMAYAWLRTGSLPDWGVYLETIDFYSLLGWGLYGTAAFTVWVITVSAIMAAAVWVVFRLFTVDDTTYHARQLPLLMLLAGGVLQVLYWVRVSGDTNLLPLMKMGIVVIAYGYAAVLDSDTVGRFKRPIEFAVACLFFGFWAGNAMLPNNAPLPARTPAQAIVEAVGERQSPDFNLSVLTNLPTPYLQYRYAHIGDVIIDEAVALVDQYAADQDAIALFIPSETATDTLMRTRKGDVFRLGHPNMVSYNPPMLPWVLAKPLPGLAGQLLFLSTDTSTIDPVHQALLEQIEQQYTLHSVDESGEFVNVYRLERCNTADGCD